MGAYAAFNLPGKEHIYKRVQAALDYCEETVDTEFKESAPWDSLKSKIVKTSLAFANLRDGGQIIIGLSERGKQWELTGIEELHLSTYDPDIISSYVNKYASPDIDLVSIIYKDNANKQYLVISVSEFDTTPVVAKKPLDAKTRAGDMFVRLRGPIRTTRIIDAREMSEVLDLAAEKKAKRLIQAARHIGLIVPGEQLVDKGGGEKTTSVDNDGFDNEKSIMSKTREVASLNTLPYWQFVVRPAAYKPNRIRSISDLWRTIDSVRIRRMGQDFPLLLQPDEYRTIGESWVGAWSELSLGPQEWKFFQSGQYVNDLAIFGCTAKGKKLHEEWATGHGLVPQYDSQVPVTGYIGIDRTINLLVLLTEFAARLCSKGVIDDRCVINVSMLRIQGIVLMAGKRRAWHETPRSKINKLENTWTFTIDDLVADPITPPIEMAIWFFERLGWLDPSREVIRKAVEDFRAGR